MVRSHRKAGVALFGDSIRTAKTVVLKGRACGSKGGRESKWGRRVIHRGRHHDPRRARGSPQAARHVHRLHRADRPAPPGLGGRRQLGRRGHGGPRHPDRRDPAGRRRVPGQRRRGRDPGRPAPQVPQGLDGGDRPDHPARRWEVRRQGLPGLGGPPRRRDLGRQRPVHPPPARGRPGRPALGGRVREGGQGQAEGHGDRPGPQGPQHRRAEDGHDRHLLAGRLGLRRDRVPAPRRSWSACRSWPS